MVAIGCLGVRPLRHHLACLVRCFAVLAGLLCGLLAGLSPGPATSAGFPNVPQTPGTVLSGINAPQQGRTPIIAFHHGVLFTVPEIPSSQPGSDFQVRSWDLADPSNPVELATHGRTRMPINAHGYLKSGDYLMIGPNASDDGPWSFRANGPVGALERVPFPQLDCISSRGCLFQPWYVGRTFWSYNQVAGQATLEKPRGNVLGSWDHLGMTGVIGHPILLGDLLIFASDQSRTGVATYDVSDPTNPVLLDVLNTGGPGGYWPEVWGGDGKLYVVFPYRRVGNGIRIVDATDPTDLRFVTDRHLPGAQAMYVQFQDHYAFMGDHKVDLRTFDSVLFLDGANTVRPDGKGVGIDTSQLALPLGNLLVTGGSGRNQGMAVWAHQAAPDTLGPSVGFHIPQAGRTHYPVDAPISLLIHETLETPTIVNGATFIVRPVDGAAITGRLTFSFNDVLTFTPDQPLALDTTYEVVLPGGGIEDVAGNGMLAYSFTFSTGSRVGGNRPPEATSLVASTYPASPAAALTLTATASDPDLDPLEYRFDFGDGRPKTAWARASTTPVTYDQPGHFRPLVQVRDPSGSLATRSTVITVAVPPAGPRPTQSAPIACDPGNRRIWNVNPDNDTVTAVNADTLTKELEVAACDDPRSLAISAGGDLWVACYRDDRIAILAGDSGTLLDEIPLGYGGAPVGIAGSPDGNTLFVTLEGGGQLVRFDAASRTETGRLALGPTPRALAVSADGAQVLVTRFLSPKDEAQVWQVAASSMSLETTIDIPKFGGDMHRDTTASGRGIANYLSSIVIAPDGHSAWLTANKPNRERGSFFAEDLDQDNTVRNILVQLDLTTREYRRSIDIDNSDSAASLAFTPLGDYLFVTLQGNNELLALDALALDAASGLGSFVARLGTGAAPQGVCFDVATNRTFVKNLTSRDVTAIETDGLFRTGDLTVSSEEVTTVSTEALSPQVLLGKQVFYHAGDLRMSSEGYLSCATCHIDGRHDGRTWDFTGRGEGFRNTATLHGRGGLSQGNVHWTANFDEIQDFENDIRGGFGGLGFMTDADFMATSPPLGPSKAGLSPTLDALAAYVGSLDRTTLPASPHRDPDGSITTAGLAGQVLFTQLQCNGCHAGENFTDGRQGTSVLLHDVGTLRTTSGERLGGPLTGIDTPTLLGLWDTAPYLHDGSALDVNSVFSMAGGRVIQAEDGVALAGAEIVDQGIEPNHDNTVHLNALVTLHVTNAQLVLEAVDGGSGGVGAIELRYSVSSSEPITVRVNGVAHSIVLAPVGNEPAWRHTNWGRARVEGALFQSGETNTIEITGDGASPRISIDDVTVSTFDDLVKAEPHRRVLALTQHDQVDLVSYLLQLDAQSLGGLPGLLFADGFESGDTSAWPGSVP